MSTTNYTCLHHDDQQRAACPVCLVASLTTERDQLRARAERAEADAATYLKRSESFRKIGDEAEAALDQVATALKDAISTYFGDDKLVTAERIEAWQAALKEDVK